MENCFKFKYLDAITYTKDNKEKALIKAYCNFGFVVKFYTTATKLSEIEDFMQDNNFDDISSFVVVRYDTDKNKFDYYIKK